jgi:hypothetical protein
MKTDCILLSETRVSKKRNKDQGSKQSVPFKTKDWVRYMFWPVSIGHTR